MRGAVGDPRRSLRVVDERRRRPRRVRRGRSAGCASATRCRWHARWSRRRSRPASRSRSARGRRACRQPDVEMAVVVGRVGARRHAMRAPASPGPWCRSRPEERVEERQHQRAVVAPRPGRLVVGAGVRRTRPSPASRAGPNSYGTPTASPTRWPQTPPASRSAERRSSHRIRPG